MGTVGQDGRVTQGSSRTQTSHSHLYTHSQCHAMSSKPLGNNLSHGNTA